MGPADNKPEHDRTPASASTPAAADAGPGSDFTEGGAPTDGAHQAVGDGTLTGSIPAGLTADEMLECAATDQPDNPGSE